MDQQIATASELRPEEMVKFAFVFPACHNALSFCLRMNKEANTRAGYTLEEGAWHAKVWRNRTLTGEEITSFEAFLKVYADAFGGEPLGWVCRKT